MKKFKLYPPGIFWLCLFSFTILSWFFPHEFTDSYWISFGIGIIIFLSGCSLMFFSWNLFRKNKNPIKPDAKAIKLITKGPYKYSRNPMYLAFFLILASFSFILNQIIILLSPLIFILLMEMFFLPLEENSLETVFGKEYKKYKEKVRAWI